MPYLCFLKSNIANRKKLTKNRILKREAVEKKAIVPPADIRVQADMFARGVEIMKRARYRRLSVSHWGRTTRERNIYNVLTFSGKVCVPFSSGAGDGWMDTSSSRTIDWMVIIEELMRVINQLPCQ